MKKKRIKKIRVGVFSFTCDEGCSINFLEILNKKVFEWGDYLDFRHFRLLKSKGQMKDLDLAIIEGAISTFKEVEKIKEIRKNSKKIILMGNCAITGEPSNQRNYFDKKRIKEIQPVLERFGHMRKVRSVKELIKSEELVPGCPMDEAKFIEVMEKCLKEFGVKYAS